MTTIQFRVHKIYISFQLWHSLWLWPVCMFVRVELVIKSIFLKDLQKYQQNSKNSISGAFKDNWNLLNVLEQSFYGEYSYMIAISNVSHLWPVYLLVRVEVVIKSIFNFFLRNIIKTPKIVSPPSLKIFAICWVFWNRYFMVINNM